MQNALTIGGYSAQRVPAWLTGAVSALFSARVSAVVAATGLVVMLYALATMRDSDFTVGVTALAMLPWGIAWSIKSINNNNNNNKTVEI